MKCPYCNGEHPDGFDFCPKTGKRIELKACTNEQCSEFGKKVLPPDAMFCPKCGCRLGETNNRTSTGINVGMINDHNYVDFGLPSGNLWATCNVGAEKPEEAGRYFPYGYLKGWYGTCWNEFSFKYEKPNYPSDYVKWKLNAKPDDLLGDLTPNAYLPLSMDAARKYMGGNWCIPLTEDFKELKKYCDWKWFDNYHDSGIGGYVITRNIIDASSNHIFLPACGYYYCEDYNNKATHNEDSMYRCSDAYYGAVSTGHNLPSVLFCSESRVGTGSGFLSCERSLLPIRAVYKNNSTGKQVILDDEEINYEADDNYLGHGYVDLGLPSGTLWATCNVGADKPEEYGDYFAWGELKGAKSGKSDFRWDTYKWCDGNWKYMTKYKCFYFNGDDRTVLDLDDDVANVEWGGHWRIPSIEQLEELEKFCTTEWTDCNKVFGYKITGRNGKSIFLPTAGEYNDDVFIDGKYMSRTLNEHRSHCICALYLSCVDFSCEESRHHYWKYERCANFSVRPVYM